MLISPSGRTMLVDAGNNDQEQIMVDYLRHYGVKRLDIVIGTHPDADHIGGLDRVIDNFDVGEIYMPKIQSNTKTFEYLLKSISKKGLKVKSAKSGLTLDWDEQVQVNMLAPVNTSDDKNNMSAVVKLTFGSTSFLLTGDAERESEQDMISSGVDLRADVMLVGHHGSKSSTTAAFLKKVNPKYAVIQVGENSYGHPKQTILDRLSKAGVKVYRNDLQGTVEIDSDGQKYSIHTER
ncbi:ComEC family competence protein [compost metagenome]